MSTSASPLLEVPVVGICGAGVTGQAVGRVARSLGVRTAWFDPQPGAAVRASRRHGGVVLDGFDDLAVVDVVVLAGPVGHAHDAASLLADGVDVVSVSDDHDDVVELLALHELA